jgi:polyisoprenoid-binding protein YceI
MKKLFIPIVAVALLASCNSAPKETAETAVAQETSAASGTTYQLDKEASLVSFLGTKPVGTHTGDFKLTEGSLTVADGNVTSGSFTIDLASLVITDKDFPYAPKLQEHLLSPDFFETAKYPTAKFEVTGSEVLTNSIEGTHKISGNLTLKDSTQNVSFPATVTVSENDFEATAKFSIDRTKWGLVYGNDKSLGDKFIYPVVEITLNLKAKK